MGKQVDRYAKILRDFAVSKENIAAFREEYEKAEIEGKSDIALSNIFSRYRDERIKYK